MKRKLLILSGILFFGTMAYAQLQGDGGNPRAYDFKNIDTRVFTTPDIALLKAEDENITTHQAALAIAEQRIQDNK